ncbi:hypothetical protein AVEN_11476-1 [Araneus ventricosus]|uniref:THAP-type domain-containing protein n=1 Tax=Araneus ventricosus TaxID=182803 RepID=A0A4Y2URL6_ARAVE|nr:hypothetical protein AVEN_11476-1 [Araneus ventricosus]
MGENPNCTDITQLEDLRLKLTKWEPNLESLCSKHQACQKHFKDGEVLQNSTFYNEKTGHTISAPMKRPKVKENAVPNYKGGNIVGMAYNSFNLATSVQVFMMYSLFSPYKDVIHIVPIDTFDVSKLFDLMKKVIMGLEE